MIAEGTAYWNAMSLGTVDPAINAAKAQGFYDTLAIVKALGGNLGIQNASPSHPGPGSQYIQAFTIAPDGAPVQSNGWPIGSSGDARLWKVFRNAAASRPIKFMYETPVTSLIQNAITKEILGVTATSGGSTINIRANKGVILACGSIEFAPDLQKQYLSFWPCYPMSGCPGNTGDGIRMAQKAGAGLMHMNTEYSGTFGVTIIPGTDPASGAKGGVTGVERVSPPGIKVNKLGNRFNMGNSVNGPVGGFNGAENVAQAFNLTTMDWDSIPCWAVFDDTLRKQTPLSKAVPSTTPGVSGVLGWFDFFSGYTWSKDNSAEIAKGWILSANSLSDLATAIAKDPDNEGKMTGAQLQATVGAWNQDCANKVDAEFFTKPTTWTPINTPPFYAIKLWPNFDHWAFGGGLASNIQMQVVDSYQQPIPRLYRAGEIGGHYYSFCTGGEHVSEAIWSGRVAAQNAAKATPWS